MKCSISGFCLVEQVQAGIVLMIKNSLVGAFQHGDVRAGAQGVLGFVFCWFVLHYLGPFLCFDRYPTANNSIDVPTNEINREDLIEFKLQFFTASKKLRSLESLHRSEFTNGHFLENRSIS